jgi:CubicO group peptidase (beta-lactamase class C family)
MTPEAPISGSCDSRFEQVREAFLRNFAEQDEVGAAVAVFLDGKKVVDLWGGWHDREQTTAWGKDSIVNVWSVGKAITAVALLRLVDAGKVDLDAPVVTYWPEFARGGKAGIPVHMLMSHRAGLPAIGKPLPPGFNLTNWLGMCEALAEQEPWWEPGTRFGYHTNTYGFLLGEIVRRVDGRSIGTFIREEIAAPLGVEFLVGFGREEDARVAHWYFYERPPGQESDRPWLEVDPATVSGLAVARVMAYRNPPAGSGRDSAGNSLYDVNSRLWRAAEYPSTNPHSNARSIAAIYSELACDGGRLLSKQLRDRANTIEADGEDAILGRPNRFGLGFQLTIPGVRPFGPNPRSFGHFGNGGLLGFADPDARVAFSYVCNRGGRSWRDPRNIALIDAVYGSIG